MGKVVLQMLWHEVTTFLGWAQWLQVAALEVGRTVVVNIDETAVERVVPNRYGNVVRLSRDTRSAALVYERITRRESHGHVTLVAAVTNDATLQPHLPQVILPKDASLTQAERASLAALAPPLLWMRDSNGWVTGQQMKDLLTLMRRAIVAQRPGFHILVVMDAANQHISNEVLSHAARLRITLLLVPSRLTWLLQPLDTHVFGTLKRVMHQRQLVLRGADADGLMPGTTWISVIADSVRDVLVGRDWSAAVQGNGLGGDLSRLRSRIASFIPGSLPLPLRPPTEAEIEELVGRYRVGIAGRLLRGALAVEHARLSLEGPGPVDPLPPLPAPPVLPPDHGRIAANTRFRALRRGGV